MAHVLMYTTGYCPFCTKARNLLTSKDVPFEDIRIDEHPQYRQEMIERSGRHTVPQIFINGLSIGGCDDLHALEQQGKLDTLLKDKQS